VVWFDRSWLGERLADIHNFLNSAFNFYIYGDSKHQKLLNLLKAFQNWQDCHWQAFKSGERCACPLLKENCSSATYFCRISKSARLSLSAFHKLLVQLRDISHPIGAKDVNSPILKSCQQIQKLLALNSLLTKTYQTITLNVPILLRRG
jgi:hypothetical protein